MTFRWMSVIIVVGACSGSAGPAAVKPAPSPAAKAVAPPVDARAGQPRVAERVVRRPARRWKANAINMSDIDVDATGGVRVRGLSGRRVRAALRSLRQGNIEPAVTAAKQALTYNTQHIPALVLLARAYIVGNDLEKAETVVQTGLGYPQGQRSARLWFLRGLLHELTSNGFSQAEKAYVKSTQLKGNYLQAWLNLGAVRIQLGDYGNAATALETAQSLDRDSAAILTNLGTAYRRAGEKHAGNTERVRLLKMAILRYRRAIAADVDYAPAYLNLAILYLGTKSVPGMTKLVRLASAVRYLREFKRLGWHETGYNELAESYLSAAQRALDRLEKRNVEPVP